MVRPSRRKRQSRNAATRQPFRIKDCIRFVISVARCGMNRSQADEFCYSNDIIPPTKNQFYLCQGQLIPIIEKLARQCCEEERKKIVGPYIISYDGSWSSRRNATHCIVEFMDQRNKIVDFDIMSRIHLGEEKKDDSYDGPSNKMEEILVEKLTKKWKNDTNLQAFVHDGDLKTAKHWKSDDPIPGPAELHDLNHLKKTVEKVFNEFNTSNELYGMKKHVMKFFAKVCRLKNKKIEQKVELWNNLENELMKIYPNRFYWRTGKNGKKRKNVKHSKEVCQKKLNDFVKASEKYVRFCSLADTQKNESFHSLKSKIAPKYISWKTSWKLRMFLTVIRWNLGENHRKWLDEKLGISYSQICSNVLTKMDEILRKKRESTKSEEWNHQRNLKRIQKRESNKIAKDGHQYANDKKNKQVVKILKDAYHLLPGIANMGYTCFVSSLIQMLYNSSIHKVFIESENSNSSNLTIKLNMIFNNLKKGENVPTYMIKELLKETPQFPPEHPNDPIEYFSNIVNNLQFIKDLLTFKITKVLVCSNCKNRKTIIENNFILNLSMNNIEDHDVIDLFRKENVNHECSVCKINQNISITEHIDALPKYLFIRPLYQSIQNISNIHLSFKNQIKVILHRGSQRPKKAYKIASLIEFYGKDNKNGHFWTLGFHDSRISVHNDSRCYFEDKEPWLNGIYFLLYELNENN